MVFPSARTGNRNVTVSNPKKLPALPAVLILSHTKELPTLLPGMLMRLDIMPKVIICQNKQLYNRTYPNRRLHFNKVKSKNDFLKNIKKKKGRNNENRFPTSFISSFVVSLKMEGHSCDNKLKDSPMGHLNFLHLSVLDMDRKGREIKILGKS